MLLGEHEPTLLVLPEGADNGDAALEAIELADECGMTLDGSQRLTLRAALGERSDGKWSAFQVCDVEPRQNGKGDTIQARELAGLFVFDEQLLIHTAHEFKTANEAFLRMVSVIKSNPDLDDQVERIRFANGEQGIELYSGARLKYFARTGGGGRGFAEADLVVYDEAFKLTSEEIAASLPTLTVSPNPQVWFASSAGLATSTQLHLLRRKALAGDSRRLAYVEHTAERPELDGDGKVVSEPVDPDDERNLALANPAYGWRFDKDFVDAERETMGDDRWLRERLGVWDPLPDDDTLKPPKIPAELWQSTAVADVPPPRAGEPTIGFEVTRDGEWASIVVAWGTPDAPHLELVEHDRGVGWLPEYLAKLAKAWKPRAIGCIGAGATGAQVGPVLFGFTDAGLDRDLLVQLSGKDYRAACEGFYVDLLEHRMTHRAAQGPLDNAAEDAAEKASGDTWTWEPRQATVPISPLVAATVARHLLLTADPLDPEPEPMFAVTT